MSKYIIISLLLVLASSQPYSITLCACNQILSEGDCTKDGCTWDTSKNTCGTSITIVTPTVTYAAYCDSFAQADCPKAQPCATCGVYAGCAWEGTKCSHFTGCTAFAKTTDDECQAISNRCITDGTHCVEVDACSTYLKQLPCVKNTVGSLCYWDTSNNVCVDANTCDKLPKTFTTDSDCRGKISTCTTQTGGGCIDSGVNCSDQLLEIQCVWNKQKNMACYWDGALCKDRICDNAPVTLVTDDTCKLFRADGTCTTKANGGCVTRTTCAAATIQAACVKNSSAGDCYWNGTACVDKTCTNAPTTMATNTACSGFVTGCITKSGGGCVANGTCSVATIQAACVKNVNNQDCIWDTTCEEKTCATAPATNTTHDLCASYLSTCTAKTGNAGCQTRTCANAPSTIATNDACEAYLPGSNCITKSGGGCVTNTTCALISIEAACVKNSSAAVCFWDTISSSCKDKICTNAPYTNTTHNLCQAFLDTCTVNASNNGCVLKSCENSLAQQICDKDNTNKACIWKGRCYQRQCSLASATTSTYADCQAYDVTCTLSNSAAGCVPIPLKCEAISIEAACQQKRVISAAGIVSYEACGWTGTQCIDKACSTASKSFTTTLQCISHLSTCVANNPVTVNGSPTIQGCIDLPSTCSARKSIENCEITRANSSTCIWNPNTSVCEDKSCATASIIGTTGVLASFTFSNCNNYLSTCISNSNNSVDGCIAKPSSCSGLISSNCQAGSKASGDCYWNGSACVEKTCANINGSSHSSCNNTVNTCTVNVAGTGCQILASTCSGYKTSGQCQITSASKACIWTGSVCRSVVCNDAGDSSSYDTDSECLNYAATTETCTVLYKVGAQGCVSRLENCIDYASQAQCARTLSSNSDDCIWIVDKCYAKSSFTSVACTTLKGTQATCRLYKLGCTNANGAIATDTCTFDCAEKSGVNGSLTWDLCQAFDTSCSVNNNGSSCVAKQAACSTYAQAACVRISATGYCFWDTAASPAAACIQPSGATCAKIIGSAGDYTHAKCQVYNTACTSNADGSKCQEYVVNCSTLAQAGCSKAQDGPCIWDAAASPSAACIQPTGATCAKISGSAGSFNHTKCQAYNITCTSIVDGSKCQEYVNNCSTLIQTNCSKAKDGPCIWDAAATPAACIQPTGATCAKITGSAGDFDHDKCQAYNTTCTSNVDGSACVQYQSNCSGYAQTSCTKTATQKCFWYAAGSPPSCIGITTPSTDCAKLTTGTISYVNCQSYNTACTMNRAGTACAEQKSTCAGYSIANCLQTSATAFCIATTSTDTACAAATTAATCEAVFLGSGNYSDANCNKFKTGCIALSTTGCQTKTCANKQNTFSHNDCNTWLDTCTVKADNSGCVTMPSKCNDASQTSSSCLRAVEGECVVVNSVCVRKSCDTAAISVSFDTDGECATYLSSCTVARTGGCQVRASCSAYKSALQCKFNTSAGKCFWNPTNLACVDLTCGNIEATTSFNTHNECVSVDATLACTVRATSGAAIAGCMARGSCGSYIIEDQCHSNSSGSPCVWNTNLTSPTCQDKSCTTASNLTITHTDCLAYYTTNNAVCTVAATANTSGGPPTLGGCQPVAACSTYIAQEQCQVNASASPCRWNGSVCADKSCATAPATADYSSDAQCKAYFSNACTVATTGQGCIEIPTSCETMIQAQCVNNKNGDLCFWNTTTSACITRTCENAPVDTADAAACNTYLAGCTLDSVKCKTKVCEDFAYATDSLCKGAISTCTTNGTNCVTRGTCLQALNQAGCVSAADGTLCEWMATNGNAQAYCTAKNCETAPSTNTTESLCAAYFINCTTKKGGGCVTKSTCAAANVDAACTTASDGTVCQWDTKKCRIKDCQDFSGTSHTSCQALRAGCTAGLNGKCARVRNCEDTAVRAACIEGTNGPCLWIPGFTNADGTSGACFRYTSCKSLTWSSDNMCKNISEKCTTDGTKCIGITLCTETNTAGGCVTGYDGDCIQSVSALNSADPAVCKAYTSCADAFYLTHSECQTASGKCTTNGITGCTALAACSSYGKLGCYINDKGPQYVTNSNAITSTGLCTWDNRDTVCRDQNCQDLIGTTHAICSSQLSFCTSDGVTCLTKGVCSSYTTQTVCDTAVGSDGSCYWEPIQATNTTAQCRLFTCLDIQDGTSLSVCQSALSSCVSNGTNCIVKANCSTYTTKTACNAGGSDGICVFAYSHAYGAAAGTGTCQLMTACTAANNDYIACTAARDRCKWTSDYPTGTTITPSSCATHTCASYQGTNGVCGSFLSWDKKTQQVCTLVSDTCTAIDPATLGSADCFTVSGYTYTWSSSTSKCGVCTAPVITTPNNLTNNTTTNNKTTTSGYVIGIVSVVFGYLFF